MRETEKSTRALEAISTIGIGRDGERHGGKLSACRTRYRHGAVSSGGDQAVIKNKFNFAFFGGLSEEAEEAHRVVSRVVANAPAS